MPYEKIRRWQDKPRNKRGQLRRKLKGKNILRRFRPTMADMAAREEVYMIISQSISNIWRQKPPTSRNIWFDDARVEPHPRGPRIKVKLCTPQAEQEIEIRFTPDISESECLGLFT